MSVRRTHARPGGPMTDKQEQERSPDVHVDNRERRRRERSIWRISFLLAAALHVLIFLFGPSASIPMSPFAAAGPRAGDDQAAEGVMQAVALSSAPPDAAIPPPNPIPDIEPPPPDEIEIEPDALPEVEIEMPEVPEPGVGRTVGTADRDQADQGLPEATGAGDGGTADEGLFRVVAPIPRGVMLPPTDAPSDVRGREIEVWVFIDVEGRVVPDSTRLEPSSSDRDFNEELRARAANWAFRPAREGQEVVASWWSWTFSF